MAEADLVAEMNSLKKIKKMLAKKLLRELHKTDELKHQMRQEGKAPEEILAVIREMRKQQISIKKCIDRIQLELNSTKNLLDVQQRLQPSNTLPKLHEPSTPKVQLLSPSSCSSDDQSINLDDFDVTQADKSLIQWLENSPPRNSILDSHPTLSSLRNTISKTSPSMTPTTKTNQQPQSTPNQSLFVTDPFSPLNTPLQPNLPSSNPLTPTQTPSQASIRDLVNQIEEKISSPVSLFTPPRIQNTTPLRPPLPKSPLDKELEDFIQMERRLSITSPGYQKQLKFFETGSRDPSPQRAQPASDPDLLNKEYQQVVQSLEQMAPTKNLHSPRQPKPAKVNRIPDDCYEGNDEYSSSESENEAVDDEEAVPQNLERRVTPEMEELGKRFLAFLHKKSLEVANSRKAGRGKPLQNITNVTYSNK